MHTLRHIVLMLLMLLPFQTAVAAVAAPAMPTVAVAGTMPMTTHPCAGAPRDAHAQHLAGTDGSSPCQQHCAAQSQLAGAAVLPALPPFATVRNAAALPRLSGRTTAPPLRPPLSA